MNPFLHRVCRALITVVAALSLAPGIAAASPLSFDSHFGNHGVKHTDAIVNVDQPSPNVILALTNRVVPAACLQNSNTTTSVTSPAGQSSAPQSSAAQLPACVRQLSLKRFSASGAVDQTYGYQGFPARFRETALVGIDASGAALVLGAYGGEHISTMVYRMTSAGKPDSSFGTNGYLKLDLVTRSIDEEPAATGGCLDGSVLVASTVDGYDDNASSILIRITPNGVLDQSWGAPATPGRMVLKKLTATSLVCQPDGSALVAGEAPSVATYSSVLAHVSSSGVLDGGYWPRRRSAALSAV